MGPMDSVDRSGHNVEENNTRCSVLSIEFKRISDVKSNVGTNVPDEEVCQGHLAPLSKIPRLSTLRKRLSRLAGGY